MQAVSTTLLLLVLALCCGQGVIAQAGSLPKRKVQDYTYYVGIGTNQSFYSPSDIRFMSSVRPSFDFNLYNVRGKDDKGFDFSKGAPHYSYAFGAISHKKQWGIEFNFDHIKYYIRQNQQVRITGTISDRFIDKDTMITPDFVQLEHSDGGNYALLKLLKWMSIVQDNQQQSVVTLLIKAGGGMVIPKTNSTIMGKHRDDRYKIAGFVVALESGLRYHFSKRLFTEFNVKGAYAHYSRFLIADGIGSQQWLGLHLGLLAGVALGW